MDNNFTIPQTTFLKSCIHSFWQTVRTADFQTEIIIPKGIIEIIFNFSENSLIYTFFGGTAFNVSKCFISGFNRKPIQLQRSDSQIFFGIRFHPIVIRSILGIPAGEFANLSVDLTLLDPSVHTLWYQLIEKKTFDERVSLVSRWVESRCSLLGLQDQMFNHFLNVVDQTIPSVAELSKMLCYSSRHLSRKLYSLTGMNTEEYLAYKKFLRSVYLIHNSKLPLTEIAYVCQFADQSHFIKTFKSLAAITPGEYRNQKSPLPGHIFRNCPLNTILDAQGD